MKKILGAMRKAIQKYDMIKPNDKIAVGVSGGKDSIALLHALNLYRRFSPVPFELHAITVDMGFEGADFSAVQKYCDENNIPYHIKKTNIGKIVFDLRNEKNPCSLCANLKRGALHNAALEAGCTTVALGHHADDAVETLFMSLFYEGRLHCFSPVTYLDRKGITLIRPLIYVKERSIKFNKALEDLPRIPSGCPNDGKSKREETKQLIADLRTKYPDIIDRVIKAMENKDQTKLWF